MLFLSGIATDSAQCCDAKEETLRVSLFITCYNDLLFPETGKSIVRLLERLGHTVEFPLEQSRCGARSRLTRHGLEARRPGSGEAVS